MLACFLSSASNYSTLTHCEIISLSLFFLEPKTLFRVHLSWCSVVGSERSETVVRHEGHNWARNPHSSIRIHTLRTWKIQVCDAPKHILSEYLIYVKYFEQNFSLCSCRKKIIKLSFQKTLKKNLRQGYFSLKTLWIYRT